MYKCIYLHIYVFIHLYTYIRDYEGNMRMGVYLDIRFRCICVYKGKYFF